MPWQASCVAERLSNFSPLPGRSIEFRNLILVTKGRHLSSKDFTDGVQQLVDMRYVVLPNGGESTGLIITEQGYSAMFE